MQLGSTALTVWLGRRHEPSGPGRASGASSSASPNACARSTTRCPDDWRLFTEHKPYEPAFYSTVVSDWGSSLLLAQAAGPQARVPRRPRPPSARTRTSSRSSRRLAMTGRLGGFHFNDSKYGDDDLTVGSIHPYQLFLVVLELLEHGGGRDAPARLHDRPEPQPQGPDRGPRSRRPTRSSTRSRSAPASTARRSRPRRRRTTRRWRPRSSRPRTAPTSGRSSPRLAGGTAPRSIR